MQDIWCSLQTSERPVDVQGPCDHERARLGLPARLMAITDGGGGGRGVKAKCKCMRISVDSSACVLHIEISLEKVGESIIRRSKLRHGGGRARIPEGHLEQASSNALRHAHHHEPAVCPARHEILRVCPAAAQHLVGVELDGVERNCPPAGTESHISCSWLHCQPSQ